MCPLHSQPVTDITSKNLICNSGFVQPVSDVVASVPAGGVVAAEFHHTSAGYVGPDPADPLDPTNKGALCFVLSARAYWLNSRILIPRPRPGLSVSCDTAYTEGSLL